MPKNGTSLGITSLLISAVALIVGITALYQSYRFEKNADESLALIGRIAKDRLPTPFPAGWYLTARLGAADSATLAQAKRAFEAGRFAQADSLCDFVLARESTPPTLVLKGLAQRKLHLLPQAAKSLDKALLLDSTDGMAHFWLAWVTGERAKALLDTIMQHGDTSRYDEDKALWAEAERHYSTALHSKVLIGIEGVIWAKVNRWWARAHQGKD